MTFVSRRRVRFAHVDAAGIVFYPRYFEMLNAVVEDYFAEVMGVDFRRIHVELGLGVPTVRLEADFMSPSRLGDVLDFGLQVARTGRSSADLEIEAQCGGEVRFKARAVLVCIDLARGRAVAWPDTLRPVEARDDTAA